MKGIYCSLINEANALMNTFTISYNVREHEDELFSSTYDELTNWVRNALKLIEQREVNGKQSEIYQYIRRFRGRAGDITLKELRNIVSSLESISN
jgi:hypothetical protein